MKQHQPTAALIFVFTSLWLNACTSVREIQPVVKRPLQTSWEGVPPSVSVSDVPRPPDAWWHLFHDDVLDRLMREGLARNLDVQLAEARIMQARAQRRLAQAALWPQFTGTASDDFSHSTFVPLARERNVQAALNGNWVVDLFGGLRNQSRAAKAALQASAFDRDAVKLTLISEIAGNYVQYRLYQLQYSISLRSANSQSDTVRITRVRFEQGAASRLDLERVESQLATTRAAVPQAREQAEAARNSLILLIASTPEAVGADLPQEMPEDPKLPSGSPLDVLLTPAQVIALRPDVRSAELRLVSAAATLTATLAQRYPQLTLGGLFGTAGTAVNQLMGVTAGAWSYSAGITLPLFDFGRIRASIDVADALQLQAYLSYEQTVRSALQATQSAIVLYAQGVLREQQLEAALNSARHAAQLARTQYQEGVLSLLEVLDAERAAYDTELSWSQAAAAVSQRIVTVYQAMGVLPPDLGRNFKTIECESLTQTVPFDPKACQSTPT